MTTAEAALDSTTGLLWQRASPLSTLTQANALSYCDTLELASHSDWRLPTRIELASIINYGMKSPAAYLDGFPDSTSEPFWSSSETANEPSSGWAVNFTDGGVTAQSKGNSLRVRCVR